VLTAHDLLPREPRPLQVRAQRRLYNAVDAIVAHSEFGRSVLVDQLRVDPSRVRVIHHGAFDYLTRLPGDQLPSELANESSTPIVMFFGLLRPYKGVDVLLEAWRSVAAERAELWIVGRPRMAIDPLVAASPRSVKWVTRFVSESELAACFRRADVMALPYVRTDRFDFSGVLASALAFGKAVVLTEVGGFREVADAGAAMLVAPGDPEALAAALSRLLADAQLRGRLEAGARAAADGPYSWDRVAEQTLALYRELAERGTSASRSARR
jgi:glycosyltransferase involved in cell wall biosynthesis